MHPWRIYIINTVLVRWSSLSFVGSPYNRDRIYFDGSTCATDHKQDRGLGEFLTELESSSSGSKHLLMDDFGVAPLHCGEVRQRHFITPFNGRAADVTKANNTGL